MGGGVCLHKPEAPTSSSSFSTVLASAPIMVSETLRDGLSPLAYGLLLRNSGLLCSPNKGPRSAFSDNWSMTTFCYTTTTTTTPRARAHHQLPRIQFKPLIYETYRPTHIHNFEQYLVPSGTLLTKHERDPAPQTIHVSRRPVFALTIPYGSMITTYLHPGSSRYGGPFFLPPFAVPKIKQMAFYGYRRKSNVLYMLALAHRE
jgi:hypothetical protein